MALERKVRVDPQAALFDIGDPWQEHWWGMPDYSMGDCRPQFRITVNLFSMEDLIEFGRRVGWPVTTSTDTITFPPEEVDKPSDWVYTDEA